MTPCMADPAMTGSMAARGKFCLGYCNGPSLYVDRVRRFTVVRSQDGRLIDADGLTVEDFGLAAEDGGQGIGVVKVDIIRR